MAELPHQELNEKLKKLTLCGIKPLSEELGTGAYSRTYTVRYREVVCAAKEICQTGLFGVFATTQRVDLERECVRCSDLIHPNIVRFMGINYPSHASLPVMVMELMDESLTKFLQQQSITLKRKISILHDVAEGLGYLHTRDPPLIHCNLSPNNVLLKHNGILPVAKISDLCMATVVQAGRRNPSAKAQESSVDFLPPEVAEHKYGVSFDVFSFGSIMLYTINQVWPMPKPPAQLNPLTNEMKNLDQAERRKEYLDKITGEAGVFKSMIKGCLNDDPDMRPSILHLSALIEPLRVSLLYV